MAETQGVAGVVDHRDRRCGLPEHEALDRRGGQGGDIVDQTIICEELARSLAGLTFAWGNTSFSGAKSVGLYGSEAQKRELLPALARGELMFAIALTEPGGGSDALGNLRTRARKVDGGWMINGLKTWSTGAAAADRLLVVTRTSDGERHGAAVALVGRGAAALEETRRRAEAAGVDPARLLVHAADVTSVAAMAGVCAEVAGAFGGVDVLFNCAGATGKVGSLAREAEENFDLVFGVNVKGTWAGCRAAIPLMKARGGGSIVNCASAVALRGFGGMASYSAAKHAVVGLTRSLAVELAPREIRVNVVCPGPTETPMLDDLRAQRGRAIGDDGSDEPGVPRIADPREVARTVAFLASAQARSITGAVLSVDGGVAAGR